MLPADDDICDITREVFASFGYSTSPVPRVDLPVGLTSYVHIAGASTATVSVQMPFELAGRLAANMFETPSSSLPEGEDVRDIAGEIANMIGGNLKALLPGPSRLSIPVIEHGRERIERSAENKTAETAIAFECELGQFVVKVTVHG
ncbi:MAG TPA: chemotaxis protein CheX [Labilithrix sp.]|jgi:chemotaxis protein CheX|nr:chemotaxis protein CheX [Labilithrix sp.]